MTHTASMREKLFTMRMSEEEWLRAAAVAKHFGLNLAGAIRMLLKEKARDLDIEPDEVGRRTSKKVATKRR